MLEIMCRLQENKKEQLNAPSLYIPPLGMRYTIAAHTETQLITTTTSTQSLLHIMTPYSLVRIK